MAEYIERQAAIDAIHEEFDDCVVWDESGERTADEVESIIDRVPSADVIPVVRCKDCEWATKSTELPGWYMCKCEEAFDYYAKPDDFCSHGERKE